MKKINQTGQATVEYILMLAVVMGFVFYVFNHPGVKDFLASDGALFGKLKNTIQYSYRHAMGGVVSERYPANYSEASHPSYVGGTETRFFGPAQEYPRN